MGHFKLIDLPTFNDGRGSLTVMDEVLPFPAVRFYWIYGSEGMTRGGHRHEVTHQALISVAGKVSVFMDDGVTQSVIVLDNPRKCLLVEPKDWHTMTFEEGAVLLVIASHPYNRSDYIDQRYA